MLTEHTESETPATETTEVLVRVRERERLPYKCDCLRIRRKCAVIIVHGSIRGCQNGRMTRYHTHVLHVPDTFTPRKLHTRP